MKNARNCLFTQKEERRRKLCYCCDNGHSKSVVIQFILLFLHYIIFPGSSRLLHHISFLAETTAFTQCICVCGRRGIKNQHNITHIAQAKYCVYCDFSFTIVISFFLLHTHTAPVWPNEKKEKIYVNFMQCFINKDYIIIIIVVIYLRDRVRSHSIYTLPANENKHK